MERLKRLLGTVINNMNVHKFDGVLGWIVQAYRKQQPQARSVDVTKALQTAVTVIRHPVARKVAVRLITDAHQNPIVFGITGYQHMTLLELFDAVLRRVQDVNLLADVLIEMRSGMCLEGRVNRLLQLLATTL